MTACRGITLLFLLSSVLAGCEYAHGSNRTVFMAVRDAQTKEPLKAPVHYDFSAYARSMVAGFDGSVCSGWGPDMWLTLGPKIYYKIEVDAPGYEVMHYDFNPLDQDGRWCLPKKSRFYMPEKQLEMQLTVQK